MEKIAVVILNWNGEKMLRTFLPGVVKFSNPIGTVYVADNGSTDHSIELLEKEFPTVKRIVFDRNYGFAEGYNMALKQIDAEYYLLLNSDVEITDYWLAPLLEYMEKHPEVAACQPKLLSQSAPEYFEYAGAAGGFIDYLGYPFCRGRIMSAVEKDEGQYDDIFPVFWATGAALMIRKEAYWQAGGLDGDFFAHMEEIDLCWRLHHLGYSIVCVPQSKVYHVGGGTLPKENPRKTYLNFRNNLLMLYKNLPSDELCRILSIRFVLDFVAAIQFLMKGESRSFVAVFKAYREFYKWKTQYKLKRTEVQNKSLKKPIPERTSYSILYAYYLRGIRKFKQL